MASAVPPIPTVRPIAAPIAIAIHGGCGALERAALTEDDWAAVREDLGRALRAGWAILTAGGPSIDTVTAAVVVLEDSPHFNAGHGAALNEAGEHELDASIMDGATLAAGGVCAVRRIRNPVLAARALMDDGRAVLLAGDAADAFAAAQGLETVHNSHFTTARCVAALARLRERSARGGFGQATEADRHGTVGAVALDGGGNLAAATSTGGFNNKPIGRIGDSPIPGAGTWAANGVCAISGTGQGEIFIRRAAAHDIWARMAYAKQSLDEACEAVVHDTLSAHRVGAGVIGCDRSGRIAAPYNTVGMHRGWIRGTVGSPARVIVGTHADLHDVGAADD